MVNSKWKCKWSGLVITATELNEGKWRGIVTIFLEIDIPKFDKWNARFALFSGICRFRGKTKYAEWQIEEKLFCLFIIFFLFVYLCFSCCLFGIFVSVFFHSSHDFQLPVTGNLTVDQTKQPPPQPENVLPVLFSLRHKRNLNGNLLW